MSQETKQWQRVCFLLSYYQFRCLDFRYFDCINSATKIYLRDKINIYGFNVTVIYNLAKTGNAKYNIYYSLFCNKMQEIGFIRWRGQNLQKCIFRCIVISAFYLDLIREEFCLLLVTRLVSQFETFSSPTQFLLLDLFN